MNNPSTIDTQHSIVFFDGVCNVCNASVQFLIKVDAQKKLRYASLQSEFAQRVIPRLASKEPDSIVLLHNGELFTHSNAVLKIAELLGGVWRLAIVFSFVPTPLRNWMYTLFARNRYRMFGKQDSCMIPTPEIRSLFID